MAAKYRIKQTVWGNWYGYCGTRKVIAFSNPIPNYGARQEAETWLNKMTTAAADHKGTRKQKIEGAR